MRDDLDVCIVPDDVRGANDVHDERDVRNFRVDVRGGMVINDFSRNILHYYTYQSTWLLLSTLTFNKSGSRDVYLAAISYSTYHIPPSV